MNSFNNNGILLSPQIMTQNLQKYCVKLGIFNDVTFELDDGQVKAHRAILVARCEVMRAMLSGDFREAHTNIVSSDSLIKIIHIFYLYRYRFRSFFLE